MQKLLKICPESLNALASLTILQVWLEELLLLLHVYQQRLLGKVCQRGILRYVIFSITLCCETICLWILQGYSFLLRDLPFDVVRFRIYRQLRIGYKLVEKSNFSDPAENVVSGAFGSCWFTKIVIDNKKPKQISHKDEFD